MVRPRLLYDHLHVHGPLIWNTVRSVSTLSVLVWYRHLYLEPSKWRIGRGVQEQCPKQGSIGEFGNYQANLLDCFIKLILAPSWTNRRAVARPITLFPPVMTAVFPSSRFVTTSVLSHTKDIVLIYLKFGSPVEVTNVLFNDTRTCLRSYSARENIHWFPRSTGIGLAGTSKPMVIYLMTLDLCYNFEQSI